MAPSNVEATVIIVDIGSTTSAETKSGISFFKQSMACISRIIERKIFSRPKDLIGLVVMGSTETNNNLATDGTYENISIAIGISNPSWDMIETLRDKIEPSCSQADWFDALVVGTDFLRCGLADHKCSRKKLVLMTDFKTPSELDNEQTQQLIENLNNCEIEPIIIGHDLDDLENTETKTFIKLLVENADGIVRSFEDANSELKFLKKKAVSSYAWYADLSIGSGIKIPIAGYPKIREAKSSIKWTPVAKVNNETNSTTEPEAVVRIKSYFKKDDNTAAVCSQDLIPGYLYGQTIVPFSKIDKTMEYTAGEKCLALYGFTKKENINWNNLIGDGTTYIVPKKGCDDAKSAIDALVTVLSQSQFVAVARKVYMANKGPNMVALFPIIKKDYKCLSMINLAFKEDYRYIAVPKLAQKKFFPNQDQIDCVDELIKAMDLSSKDDKNRKVFSMDETVNPKQQYTFDCIAHRALNPRVPLPPPRPEIQNHLEPPTFTAKLAKESLEKVKEFFPLVTNEKTKGGKHWVDQHFAREEGKLKVEDLPVSSNLSSVTSVLTPNITKVGSINPSEDFKQLIKLGKPLETVCQQLQQVVESLVIHAFGDDFSKPVAAISTMREECLLKNPEIYNEWLKKFKMILLDKLKTVFLQHLLDNNMGLISITETTSSSVSEREALDFGYVTTFKPAPDPIVTDTSEIDDLFADDF